MRFVVFVTPFFKESAIRFIQAIPTLSNVRLAVISQDPQESLPDGVRAKISLHWRVEDALNSDQLAFAARMLSQQAGLPIYRLLGAMEQVQIQLAEVRQQLGISGMNVEIAKNFRDKARMKQLLREKGIPCARYRRVLSAEDAWSFVQEVGYPIVLKPVDGAATQATFQVNGPDSMESALRQIAPQPNRQAIAEEFIVGDEYSFETFSIDGQPVWHSLTRYLPTPLEVMRNPWMQWCVLLPREVDAPQYDDIRQIGQQAVAALGMETGMTHLEWFRRRDGTIAISEVAARPPGAQIMTLISRATDTDSIQTWIKMMVDGVFIVPERKYAVGAAFLRGQGRGRVRAVHGLEQAEQQVGHLVTDVRLPQIGQPASISYEGEGYVVLRHPQTEVVEEALKKLVSLIRVELG